MSNITVPPPDEEIRKAVVLLKMRDDESLPLLEQLALWLEIRDIPEAIRAQAEARLKAGPKVAPRRQPAHKAAKEQPANQVSYAECKQNVNLLKAYATTGLDSASRRIDALTQLDAVIQELKDWKFLEGTPNKMQTAVEKAHQSLFPPMETLDNWTKDLDRIAVELPEFASDPGFDADDAEPSALNLAKRLNEVNRKLTLARAQINDGKEAIGKVWTTITEATQFLAGTIESEVKHAVARVHNEGIEAMATFQTIGGRILDLLGIIDPTLLGELGLKGVKVALEGSLEVGKLGAEVYKASNITIEEALDEYGEWDIAIASAERWKGGVKIAIHTAGIAIPKFGLVSPTIDAIIETYFDAAVKKGKAEQQKVKKGGQADESLETYWTSFKENLIEQFAPTNMTEVTNGYLGGLSGLMDADSAKDLGGEIVGKLSAAIMGVLTEKLLPIEPAQPVPALDIKARLGSLRAVYDTALKRRMDPALKADFDKAMSSI
jgi:hypothetical protein